MKMRLICEVCVIQLNRTTEPVHPEFDNYAAWISHLLGKSHQKRLETQKHSFEASESEFSVVITGDVQPRRVLKYFSRYGIIGEFYDSPRFFVVTVGPMEENVNEINFAAQHEIDGRPVKLYLLSQMTPDDWNGINQNQQNGSTISGMANLNIQVNSNSRTIMAANPVVDPGPPRPQAEIVTSSSSSGGTSQASSVSGSQNGPTQPREKKRSRHRSKPKTKAAMERRGTDEGPTVNIASGPVLTSNILFSSSSQSQPDPQPPAEVQFRGGFNLMVRQSGPPNPPISVPTTPTPQPRNPLPLYNPGPYAVLSPSIQTPNQARHQVHPSQMANHCQRGVPGPMPQQMRHNSQEFSRPHVNMSMHPPRQQVYQGQHHYNQNMHPPGQHFPQHQQRMMRPLLLPPGAFPNSSQNAGASASRNQNQTPTKFTKLFYSMLDNPYMAQQHVAKKFTELPLKDQFREFLSALCLDDHARRLRDSFLTDLQTVLRKEYPKCIVYPFGSFLTGLGDLHSDVDVYIDAFGITRGEQLPKTESSTIEILNKCRDILRRAKCPQSFKAFCSMIIPIRDARVPILKCTHALHKINFDVSFENLISVRNTELINLYMKLHPVVRPLLILLRYWGKFHNLTGSNLIKNYALILLVLVFLGQEKIVPTVANLQKMQANERKKHVRGNATVNNPDIIDGWDTSFYDNVDRIKAEFPPSLSMEEAGSNLVGTVGKVAEKFFDLYAKADFGYCAVCPYSCEFIPKHLFKAGCEEDLPEMLDRYKEWSSQQPADRRLNIKNPLCIQDPFILSFNVGAVTPVGTLLKFQVACAQTCKQLRDFSVSSLLDYFIPLPKEVGDNKFMTMQKKQKLTKDLSKEIISFVRDGVVDLSGTSEETPEEIPLHLLPLEQIVDKKSIRFGQGWECFSSFQADRNFLDLFVQQTKACKNSSITPSVLLQKLKILWIGFIEDFLSEFWETCLQLSVSQQERVKIERTFADPPFGARTKKNYEGMFTERREKKGKQELFASDRVKRIRGKLMDLGPLEERIMYRILTITADKYVWFNRDQTYWQVLNRQLSETGPPGVSRKAPKANSKKKKKDKKTGTAGLLDPLRVEEEVTRVILGSSGEGKSSGKKKGFKFVCLIKFDCSLVDDIPEIFFVFEKVEGSQESYEDFVSQIVDTLNYTLPEYAFYRLKKWLEIEPPKELNIEKSGTDPAQEEEQKPDDSTGLEDDELLLPPSSSSSESSEFPVLADVQNT